MSVAANIDCVTPQGADAGRRLRVLLSAYACHPHEGSEPSVGWHWLRGIARLHDVCLLTEAQRYAEPVARALEEDPALRNTVQIVAVPRERRAERWLGALAYYRTYRQWQWSAYQRALELHRRAPFDLAHHLNMIGYREPGYLWRLDIPFIWGPIGGHAQMPWRYLTVGGVRGAVHLAARNLVNAMQMRCSVRVRRAYQRSACVIAATGTDREALARLRGIAAPLIPETGCEPIPGADVRARRAGEPLKVLWCGRMLPSKAAFIALGAVAAAGRRVPAEFHLYGDGPGLSAARRWAQELGIAECCIFHGRVRRSEVIEAMHVAHVLLFPSLLEASSATVPEALATGLPVICHRTCGQGDIVDATCGVAVPVNTPASSVTAMAAALMRLYDDPEWLKALSRGARRRAHLFGWDQKARAADGLYRQALAASRSAM